MRARGVALVTLIGIALWSCADAGPHDVTVQLFQFRPAWLEVTRGTVVTWSNRDEIRHTVTAGTPERRAGTFGVELAGRGTGGSVTFAEPGTHPYFCERHQNMRGEIHLR